MKVALDWLEHALVFVGSVASVYAIVRTWSYWRRVSWGRVRRGVLALRDKLAADQFMPTMIVGIGRGGAIVGALISGLLGGIPIIACERRYRWTQEQGRTEEIVLPPQLTEGFDRILLVAGEVHSGNTMRTFVRFLRDQGAHEIRTYALQKSVAPTFAPDYWSLQTDRDLLLPWMLTADYPHQDRRG